MRAAAEPVQLEALAKFAERAYRRPLSKAERDGLIVYYQKLRKQGALSHEDAMRDSVASILISPVFLYRVDLTGSRHRLPGAGSVYRVEFPSPDTISRAGSVIFCGPACPIRSC